MFVSTCEVVAKSPQESNRIQSRLNSLSSAPDTPSFWLDRTKGFVLATLQDHASQVKSFVESCRTAMTLIYSAMFPLNEQPRGFEALMRKFRHGEAMKGFVRAQLVAGAEAALAFVHVHHPSLSLEEVC